ncbi:MAG: hypothetical protein LBP40_00315, partial [Campylobacteraceae bacterium]|nr:hypothetical protein [Campylobacteraceae bacterium]
MLSNVTHNIHEYDTFRGADTSALIEKETSLSLSLKITKFLAVLSVPFLLAGCGGGGSGGSDGGNTTRSYSYNIASVSAGSEHSLALASDGKVYAAGQNNVGQLGLGSGSTDDVTSFTETTYLNVLSGENIVSIAAGGDYSLALSISGVVYAAGENGNGQLGLNDTNDRPVFAEVTSLNGKKIVAIAAGTAHSLAVDENGTVYAAGLNTNGRLGDGTTTQRTSFVPITSLSGVKIV